MTIADSSRSSLAYVQEPPGGLVGTEVFRLLRNTGNSLVGSITSSPNEEIRSDRQVSGSSHISATSGGDVNIQLSYGEYDDFLEALLGSSGWTTFSQNTTVFVTATKNITMASTAGLVPEQVIKISGSTSNDGIFTVATVVDATHITVNEVLVDEAASAGVATSSMIMNETTDRKFAFEQALQDVTEFALFEGQRVGALKLTLGNSQLNGGFTFMGTNANRSGASVSVGGISAYNASLSNDVLNGASGLESISMQNVNTDGSHDAPASEIFESMDLTITSALREQPGLGSLYPIGIGVGTFSADISTNIYFQSRTLFNSFLANELMTIRFAITDDESDITLGNSYHFSFPGCRVQTYTASPEAENTDVMAKVAFKAMIDPYLTNKTCVITRIPAP